MRRKKLRQAVAVLLTPELLDGGPVQDARTGEIIGREEIEDAVNEWGELVATFFDIHAGMLSLAWQDVDSLPVTFRPAFRIFQSIIAEYLKPKKENV